MSSTEAAQVNATEAAPADDGRREIERASFWARIRRLLPRWCWSEQERDADEATIRAEQQQQQNSGKEEGYLQFDDTNNL